jgi:tetratricopeptide (TPR) repeat protein
MRTSRLVLFVAAALCGTAAALAAGSGGGSGGMGGGGSDRVPTTQTPEERALSAYNAGVRGVKKADSLVADAARATDPAKREKATKRAADGYRKALAKFEKAVQANPSLHEAWNYIGYTKRKLGDYDAALTAYDRALALRPDFAEAIEYRGEAYLRLNRLEEAKQAYLDLFAANRALSDQLLASMREWVATERVGTSADPAALEEFDKWVQERATIAGQTAALTRDGASSAWK